MRFGDKTYDYSDYKFTYRHAEDFSGKRKYKVIIIINEVFR